jgi:hypothetical protein
MHVSIVGTAGRKEDGQKMSRELYFKMVKRAESMLYTLCKGGDPIETIDLISGGAAWADHIAVSLYLMEVARSLTLYLPCHFNPSDGYVGFEPTGPESEEKETARIANYYHDMFSKKMGRDTRQGIANAYLKGAKLQVIDGGFKTRNLLVGKCDVLMAFTWGEDEYQPKDGGTLHTWKNSLAPIKLHYPLKDL